MARRRKSKNPTRHNKSKYTSAQKDAAYVADGRELVFRFEHRFDVELAKMNKGKRGRPFLYSNEMMAIIAYIRCRTNLGYRQMAGMSDGMLGSAHKGPSYSTIWKRIGASAVNIQNSRLTIELNNGTLCNLAADSTGISTTNCSEWITIKWNVKHNFIKLHILAEVESQKILAFRITDVTGGDAAQTPGMLDDALERLGVPPDAEPAEAKPTSEAEPALEIDMVQLAPGEKKSGIKVEFMCDCGCGKTVCEKKFTKKKKKILARLLGDGGYDSHELFAHIKRRGVQPVIRIRYNANAHSGGVGKARPEAVLDQLGGGCTAQQFAKLNNEDRKRLQKEWMKRVGYGLRWLVEIIISAFKRIFGDAVRAVKPQYILLEIATKIAAYNKRRDIIRKYC